MSKRTGKQNLGRGLAALLGEEAFAGEAGHEAASGTRTIPVEKLHPSSFQPRRSFDDEALATLAQSLRSQGMLQPIIVRAHPKKSGDFEIIAGERRWRAAQLAELREVPVSVHELADAQALEWALVENVQRADLNPLDEAEGYQRLIKDFGHRQEDLAKLIGKSRPHIANTLRLLQLPEALKPLLKDGRLSAGHARALLTAENPIALADMVIARGLSVRQTEELARAPLSDPAFRKSRQADKERGAKRDRASRELGADGGKDADSRQIEADIEAQLGLVADLTFDGSGGALTLRYKSLDQLDSLVDLLLGRG